MNMFTAKDNKNLKYVLSKIADTETAPCLEELHGLFFGIAITPEAVTPGEWQSAVFEDKLQFDDDRDAEKCTGYLLEICNRISSDVMKGKLDFPFSLYKLTRSELALIESWTHGLFLGLSLRPHIWRMSKECEGTGNKQISGEAQRVIDSYDIITTIALPEERVGIYEAIPGMPAKSPEEVMEMLYIMLPAAVECLMQHGVRLRKENPETKPPKKKINRKESSPGDSGKKDRKA
ncbi:MAG: YecA family protein [Smithella sp.]